MTYKEGSTPFFACPCYFLKDEQHPDGHAPNEKACGNRLSFVLATKIVERLMETIEEDVENGRVCDYKNYSFNCNGVRSKVLKYSPSKIRIGVLNSRIEL